MEIHVSLLKQDTIRKVRGDDENVELDAGNKNGNYEMEAIWDSEIYAKESELGHLPGLYHLVSWKGYPEVENTWEPASAVQYLRKLISSFHKDHLDRSTTTSLAINTASPMARPTVKPAEPPKQMQGRPANSTNKWAKKRVAFDFYCVFGWIWVISKSDVFSRVARDYTWLLADCFSQNFYFLTSLSFYFLTSLSFYFPTSSPLSYQASVFLLSLPSLG